MPPRATARGSPQFMNGNPIPHTVPSGQAPSTRPMGRTAVMNGMMNMMQTPPHAPFVADATVDIVDNNPNTTVTTNPTPPADTTYASDAQSPTDDTEEDALDSSQRPSAPLPPNLREISSLASWTVSTHKPGCGVAALRHPSPLQFWQSDGPQPHTLTLHFFKLVAIVRIRVYLDFELDESYTPTKMIFAAGMGGNDLVEFGVWEGESPRGWVDVDLSGVGGRDRTFTKMDGDFQNVSKSPIKMPRKKKVPHTPHRDRMTNNPIAVHTPSSEPTVPEQGAADSQLIASSSANGNHRVLRNIPVPEGGDVLKAMVVQVRVCENHQNGKDTHVRGFQVFARDNSRKGKRETKPRGGRKDTPVDGDGDEAAEAEKVTGVEEVYWMGEPEIR